MRTIITRAMSTAMSKWCQLNDIHYVNESGYPNTMRSARKVNLRGPHGVLLHVPRDTPVDSAREFDGEGCIVVNDRCYICWQGEPMEIIQAVVPFVRQHPQIQELYLLRCKDEEAGNNRDGLRND